MGYHSIIKRMLRSRGYGIHSPFAYHLVRSVLRMTSCRYYAYPSIDRSPLGRHKARLLFRLLCHFNPHTITAAGPHTRDAIAPIVAEYSSTAQITGPHAAELTVIVGTLPPDTLAGLQRDLTQMTHWALIAIFTPSTQVNSLKQILRNGMTFTSGNVTVMAARPDLPRQDFNLFF